MNNSNESENILGSNGGLGSGLPMAEFLRQLKDVLGDLLQTTDRRGSIVMNYIAPGGQHVDRIERQYFGTCGGTTAMAGDGNGGNSNGDSDAAEGTPPPPAHPATTEEGIKGCIGRLMDERADDGSPLFCLQAHWQAVYRILVDKGYCRDADFNGFDLYMGKVMPERVNKPYRRESVKCISKTDFNRPFDRWRYDPATAGNRAPYERMVAVARRFRELLEQEHL